MEDSSINKIETMRLMRRLELAFDVVDNVEDAIQKAVRENSYGLLIANLTLPRFRGKETIEGEKEGLIMLYNLSNAGIKIPTIVYSPKNLSVVEKLALMEKGYPLISKIDSVIYLEKEMKKII